ncbi:MAG TPA: fimbria/pilus periplasmic chaperone [Allosphingosinicella sp.]
MGKPAESLKCGRTLRAAVALALLATGLSAGSPAAAGSFQVNPVNVAMKAGRKTAALTIKNSDAAPVAVRVSAYRWTQENGIDVYSPTEDMVASPPIFTIAPGATQLVRIGIKGRGSGGAYRILLEEIPRQRPDGAQIQVALRLNLPLYILSPGGGKPELSWSAWRDRAGDLFIGATNRGQVHAQVLEIAAADRAAGEKILSQQMGVVLPGSARHWKIGRRSDFGVGSPMQLKVRNPAGEMQANIVVEQR